MSVARAASCGRARWFARTAPLLAACSIGAAMWGSGLAARAADKPASESNKPQTGLAASAGAATESQQQAAASPPPQQEAPPNPKSWAQFDPTGYWVSVITEDWRYRMVTAPKTDTGSIPINGDGFNIAREWDIAKDVQSGNQCKAFGAAGIMRRPGRLHITWVDDTTLRLDFDAGTQTRLLHFTGYQYPMGFTGSETPVELRRFEAPNEAPSLQGFSVAAWKKYFDGRGFAGAASGGGMGVPYPNQQGALMSMTTRLLPGYLQSNGIPYSDATVLTEYFNRVSLPHGEEWLVVTSIVEDPKYLIEPYITSTNFKREPDGSKWRPTPCETAAPLVEPTPPPAQDKQQ